MRVAFTIRVEQVEKILHPGRADGEGRDYVLLVELVVRVEVMVSAEPIVG